MYLHYIICTRNTRFGLCEITITIDKFDYDILAYAITDIYMDNGLGGMDINSQYISIYTDNENIGIDIPRADRSTVESPFVVPIEETDKTIAKIRKTMQDIFNHLEGQVNILRSEITIIPVTLATPEEHTREW